MVDDKIRNYIVEKFIKERLEPCEGNIVSYKTITENLMNFSYNLGFSPISPLIYNNFALSPILINNGYKIGEIKKNNDLTIYYIENARLHDGPTTLRDIE